MQQAQMIKLPEEITLLEEATAIADAVTASGVSAIAPGIRECEIAAEAMRTLFRLGGELRPRDDSFCRLRREHGASAPYLQRQDRTPRCGFHRYWCQLERLFRRRGAYWDLRRSLCEQRKIYTAVYDALKAGIEEMRPGRINKDAAQAVVNAAAKHGLADRFPSLFIGHGIGIGANEPPYIGGIV
jgi:Xaa-Pro aminopeptidase/Xaa-Pro dipeptidase